MGSSNFLVGLLWVLGGGQGSALEGRAIRILRSGVEGWMDTRRVDKQAVGLHRDCFGANPRLALVRDGAAGIPAPSSHSLPAYHVTSDPISQGTHTQRNAQSVPTTTGIAKTLAFRLNFSSADNAQGQQHHHPRWRTPTLPNPAAASSWSCSAKLPSARSVPSRFPSAPCIQTDQSVL